MERRSINSPCNCYGTVFLHSQVCLLKLEPITAHQTGRHSLKRHLSHYHAMHQDNTCPVHLRPIAGIAAPHIRRLLSPKMNEEHRSSTSGTLGMATQHLHAGWCLEPASCRQSCLSRWPNRKQGPTSGKMNGENTTSEPLNGWTEALHPLSVLLVVIILNGQPGSR